VDVNRAAELKPLPGVGCIAWLNEAARRGGGRSASLWGMAWVFIAFFPGLRSKSLARALVGVPGK